MAADVGWTLREKRLVIALLYRIEEEMADVDDRLDALEKSVDSMTTRVSGDLQSLKDQLANAGKLTPQEGARFDTIISKLDSFDVASPPPPDTGAGGTPAAAP